MARLIIGDENADYIGRYFLPQVEHKVENILREGVHNCGMCSRWEPEDGRTDYGRCKVRNGALVGFDCSTGKDCSLFKAAKTFDYSFEVEVVPIEEAEVVDNA